MSSFEIIKSLPVKYWSSSPKLLYLDTNYTDAVNGTEILKELNSRWVEQLAPVIGYLILIMTTGIVGNSVTCYIYRWRMKKTAANEFILWLAVLDLTTCVFGIPFDISYIALEYVFDQPVICKLLRFITYSTLITSWTTLLLIAVDRYFKICRPLKQCPIGKTRYFIVGSAMAGIISSSPILVLYGTIEVQTPYPGITGHSCSVSDTLRESPFTVIYFGIIIVSNVIFTICLFILYTCVGLQVRKRSRMTIGDKSRSRDATKSNNRPKYKVQRANILCVSITIAFVVSFYPTLILHGIMLGDEQFEEKEHHSFVIYNLFVRSCFLANAINPLIYGFLNPVFRKECVLILRRLKPDSWSQTSTKSTVWYCSE